jgi:tripartite ATP-independent transporter DctP family solute receptor
MKLNRRDLMKASVATGAALSFPAVVFGQPKHRMKFANIMPPDHPLNVRMREASEEIKQKTNGLVEISVFPSSQLGTDADMLSQLRSGGIDFFANSGLILASLVPVAAINGIGFAFPDYASVWKAMDGAVGKHVVGAIEKSGLVAFEHMWDNGFRQTLSATRAIRTPADLKGFKVRVPPSPLWTGLFRDLGASPVTIPWGETYTAMQTKVADGLENPLAGIYFAKMHEVGKYISNTNHMWDGFWFLANRRSFGALPQQAQDVVRQVVNAAALKQREDTARLNQELRASLAKNVEFLDVDTQAFRKQLQDAGFYAEWKKRMGDEAWAALESSVGKLG